MNQPDLLSNVCAATLKRRQLMAGPLGCISTGLFAASIASTSAAGAGSGGADPIRLRFVTLTAGEAFFEPVKRGMTDAAKMLGVHAEFTGSKGVDPNEMNALIRAALAQGYHGIAIDIYDAAPFRQVIAEARSKGVPVVAFNINAGAGSAGNLSGIAQNFIAAGLQLGNYVKPKVKANSVALVTMHDAGISALEERRDGIKKALASHVGEWVELITGHDPDMAKTKLLAQLKARPDIGCILATGQADTEGAALAIAALDKPRLAAGFDLSPAILQAIADGRLACTIDQQPYAQGFYPVVQLVLNIRYGLMPVDMDAGAAVIDKANVAQVMPLAAQGLR